jgi:nucleoside 2-deoxyribosyltransferase
MTSRATVMYVTSVRLLRGAFSDAYNHSDHVTRLPLGQSRRCYVASPLGFSEAGRHYYHAVLLPALATVVVPVDPWSLTSPEEISEARAAGKLHEMALEIGHRNTVAIRSCDLLVALLDGQEPDSGTAAELGYAAALEKTCFGLRSDLRQAGEEGVAVNLQLETFVVGSGGKIVASLEDLVAALQ